MEIKRTTNNKSLNNKKSSYEELFLFDLKTNISEKIQGCVIKFKIYLFYSKRKSLLKQKKTKRPMVIKKKVHLDIHFHQLLIQL